jgi:hypothetical protein
MAHKTKSRLYVSHDTVDMLKGRALQVVEWLARTSLPEILFITTFIISHFLPNADFSYPYELVMPIALLAVLISIFFYAYRAIFRRVLPAHIAALPLAYYLYHYGDLAKRGHPIFEKLLPNRWETPFTFCVLYLLGAAVLFGLIAWGLVALASLRPKLNLDLTLTKIILFIVSFNFLVQFVVVCNFWFQARHQLSYSYNAPKLAKKAGATVTSKPNIYYLLFDRYASASTLQNVYGYDNSDFINFLNDNQFVTRDNAFANYPFTMSSVSSTLSMNYEPQLAQFASDKKQTGFPYRAILNDPTVVSTLKQNGYSYNLLSSWWDFARIGVKADSEPTKSFRLHLLGHNYYQSDFSRDIINNTALSPLVKKGVSLGGLHLLKYDLDRDPEENFESQVAALKQITANRSKTPQFTFAHFLMPHDPYIFNADGSDTTYSHDRNDDGADEYTKYTSQLTYTNTQIKDMIATIKQNDPKAVIIMQTDEGPYPKEFRGSLTPTHYFDPKNLPVDHMRQKLGVLASYYFPDVDQAEVAANMTSNVNTFRFVLDHYLGYDLPQLPDCHLSMGNKFNLFSYTLLNKQLTGQDAPAECTQYLGTK